MTNVGPETLDVIAKTRRGSAPYGAPERLGVAWPPSVHSLSHVAIPFSPDDPLYGRAPIAALPLGALAPRGERNQLTVPVGNLMRLRFNPFFDYLEQRLVETVKADLAR